MFVCLKIKRTPIAVFVVHRFANEGNNIIFLKYIVFVHEFCYQLRLQLHFLLSLLFLFSSLSCILLFLFCEIFFQLFYSSFSSSIFLCRSPMYSRSSETAKAHRG
eukprot:TRINITY_DN4377_c0_g1_i1.p1 TRINITY_DN4377_c0_g1~~TRINITY_DN4377_c0_g1_i1.p1  ORF type:complete len:115 (+),score=7.10 TRINITY_DN4377_c0_g1_i1:33-347(+)